MASSYSPLLAIELIGSGDGAGTWGLSTNNNLGTLIEQAIAGYVTQAITDGADTTITIPNGLTGVARNMTLELTGALTAPRNLIVPTNHKLYFIYNNTTGGHAVTVKVTAGTGIAVPAGKRVLLVLSGVTNDIVTAVDQVVGTLSATAFSGPLTGAVTGNASTASALTPGNTINGVSFTGAAPITVTAAAGTLTGTTLNATVVTSSLTSVGTITSGTWSGLFGAVSGANLISLTAANIAAGTAGISITGNAVTATTATNQSGGTVNATTGAFSGAVTGASFAGTHTGNGAGLTAITAANISAGTAGISVTGNAGTATSATSATTATTATNQSGGTCTATAYRDDAGNVIVSSTNPTIASGFGTGPSITANNTAAFIVTVGNPSGTNTGAVSLPAAPNGWICVAQNLTNNLTLGTGGILVQTAKSTTSVTVSQCATSGVPVNFVAGDVLLFHCFPY